MPNFTLRLTDSERQLLQDEADSIGVALGSLIKYKALEGGVNLRRYPTPDRVELARISGQVGRIGGNLNQIVRAINSSKVVRNRDVIEGLRNTYKQLDDISQVIRKALHVTGSEST